MMGWRKHKTYTELIYTLSNLLWTEAEINPSGLEKICRTTATAN